MVNGKEFIQQKGFHSRTRQGSNWYSFIEANDVQRYFLEPSSTQWLHFSDRLRDKRGLAHYREPRILVQQIFWQGLCARLQEPCEPILYLNTLFSIYNARSVSLWALLGFLNSRFLSASYERWANRLFGDNFPKVSKIDLARIPIPPLNSRAESNIANAANALQESWEGLRLKFREANKELVGVSAELTLTVSINFGISAKESSVSKPMKFTVLLPRCRLSLHDVLIERRRKRSISIGI